LINLNNSKGNDTQCKSNSIPHQTHGSLARKARISSIPRTFKGNLNLNLFENKCFMILFTIFSIILPIGIQPQLQANYAFAETSQTINDEIEYSHEGNKSSNSSSSETKSKSSVNAINPFDSSIDDEDKKAKIDIIIPDIVGSDIVPETQSDSTTNSHESGTQSSGHFKPNSVDKDSSYIDNIDGANDSIIKEHDNPEATNLRSTELQISAVNNNNSVDKNIDDINDTVTDDLPSADNKDTKSDSQPNYKSYRDYIENSNVNNSNDDAVVPDNIVDNAITHLNSSVNPDIGIDDINGVDKNSDDTRNPVNDDIPSENSESMLDSQLAHNSYGQYIGNSYANKSIDDDVVSGNKVETQLTPLNSSMIPDLGNDTGNADENHISQDNQSIITNQSEFTGSQFKLDSQPKYKSYRDYIEKNNLNKDEIKINVPSEIRETESSSADNNIPFDDTNKQGDLNNELTIRSSSASTASSQVTAQSSGEIHGDFNGDGKDDLAIGVPFEDIGSAQDAGAVQVIYGSSGGLSATSPRPDQFWTQDSADVNNIAEVGDFFGSSLSSGDFNGDGVDDLAIGVPGEDLGPIESAGVVHLIYGSPNGLSATSPRPDQVWSQDIADVNNQAEENDFFGDSLSSGDFNGDGVDDLAIGVPGEDLGPVVESGIVNVIYGSPNGLSATSPRPDQVWSQDIADVDNQAEENDLFGDSLASGDFNGDGVDDLAIGVPAEDLGSIESAGAVQVIYGSSGGLSATLTRPDQFWTQDSPDIAATAGQFDNFGTSLSVGDFNDDGEDDLSIGIPGEDIGDVVEAGAAQVIYGSSGGLSATLPRPDQFWSQGSADVNYALEEDDLFGSSLSAGDFDGDGKDDLAIGVPAEDLGTVQDAGGVQVIYGSSGGLSATLHRPDQFWTQDTPNIAATAGAFDGFGSALG
jgi:hypothetical protein